MNILIVEDDKERQQAFKRNFTKKSYNLIIVDTASKAISEIDKGTEFNFIFLDNDLGPKTSGEGRDVVNYIIHKLGNTNQFNNTSFIIHSMNPVASDYMYKALRPIFPIGRVHKIPGAWRWY
jgi:DNA-binding response OmpR family regulator